MNDSEGAIEIRQGPNSMQVYPDQIGVKGKRIDVQGVEVDNHEIVVTGKLLKTARVKEEWDDDIENPKSMVAKLKSIGVRIDIFTFMQRLPESKPKHNYWMEWDNVAAIPIKNYNYWFRNQLQTNPRNKLSKSKKAGVVVKQVEFTDQFVTEIMGILNETPTRQGHRFGDYGKDFATVKQEHETFLDRSDFIAAYYKDELIGYLKLVYAHKFMRTMQILSKIKHRDKGPTNSVIAKAVEICSERGIPFLVYGKYAYGKLGRDSLREFKYHNGFEYIILPRYYVPLTIWGKAALKLRLHHGVIGILPKRLIRLLLSVREMWYTRKERILS